MRNKRAALRGETGEKDQCVYSRQAEGGRGDASRATFHPVLTHTEHEWKATHQGQTPAAPSPSTTNLIAVFTKELKPTETYND